MKSKFTTVLMSTLVIGMLNQSCKSTKTTTRVNQETGEVTEVIQDGPVVKMNRFVSVDAVTDLRTGMSYDDVVNKLGARPYNLFSAQADGHTAVQYKYRLTRIEVPVEKINNVGVEKGNNKVEYMEGEQDLYLVFNSAGKLEYMVTTQGNQTEQLLRTNNLLYVIKKDKDKFAKDNDDKYRETNSVFYPMIPCTDCNKIIRVEETKRSEVKVDVNTNEAPATAPAAAPAAPATPGKSKKGMLKSLID